MIFRWVAGSSPAMEIKQSQFLQPILYNSWACE
jgi:hypothetical protein